MEKVKITQAQVDAIESWLVDKENRTEDKLLTLHAQNNYDESSEHHCIWNNKYKAMNDLSVSTLAKALYIGYEVELEFKVWDWVTHLDLNITEKIVLIGKEWGEIAIETDRHRDRAHKWRHATESEIKQEKERRWWKLHGREVWELRKGDVLHDESAEHAEIVDRIDCRDEMTAVIFVDEQYTYFCDVKKDYKIIAFAENRLDVTSNA